MALHQGVERAAERNALEASAQDQRDAAVVGAIVAALVGGQLLHEPKALLVEGGKLQLVALVRLDRLHLRIRGLVAPRPEQLDQAGLVFLDQGQQFVVDGGLVADQFQAVAIELEFDRPGAAI
ncbi:hypothetical protein D3C87_577990 [compost metagenome]